MNGKQVWHRLPFSDSGFPERFLPGLGANPDVAQAGSRFRDFVCRCFHAEAVA
jgi:hypothetical protein